MARGAAMLLAVLFLTLATSAQARTVNCGNYVPPDRYSDAAIGIRATAVSCKVARRLAREIMLKGTDSPEGYRCPYPYGARTMRCVKGKRAVSWSIRLR